MKFIQAVLMVIGFFSRFAWADDYHEKIPKLKALEKRCEDARAARLAPIREALVRECVKDSRRSLQDCQGEASTHGESTTGARGNLIKGLFYDLPECIAADEAWKAWEASQPLRR